MERGETFPERWVHIDFKGAPPRLTYLSSLLPMLRAWGCTGLLLEFEDMFPFKGDLAVIRHPDAYQETELSNFLAEVQARGMKTVPLVQTFGHLEYLLKHEAFCHLREVSEYPNSLCPSFTESLKTVKKMIDQVAALCDGLQYLHIGCDEVGVLGSCSACQERSLSPQSIFLRHASEVAAYVRETHGLRAIMWDDMLRDMSAAQISESRIQDVVDVMVWEYRDLNNLREGYLPMLGTIFSGFWIASAFKGATSACQITTPTGFHVENHHQWIAYRQSASDSFKGIAMTGWSRFDHYGALCDLLPVALPTLAICLSMVTEGSFTKEMHESISQELGFTSLIPWHPLDKSLDLDVALAFPGWEIFQGAHILLQLDRESEMLLHGDLRKSWLSRRHVRVAQTSPGVAEKLLESAKAYLSRYRQLELGIRRGLETIFSTSAVEEWLETHVAPRRDELQDLVSDAEHLLAIGATMIRS